MNDDRRTEAPAAHRSDVPRDMPDQQAAPDAPDPWDGERPGQDAAEHDTDEQDTERPDEDDVPDTDESGTGRRGSPHSGSAEARWQRSEKTRSARRPRTRAGSRAECPGSCL